MNDEFMRKAFKEEEMDIIASRCVPAHNNPTYNTNPGNSTQDQVFLLSILEVQKFFKSEEARKCKPTDFVNNKRKSLYGDFKDGPTFWWLRSPGENSNEATGVDSLGQVIESMPFGYETGVRPALWIDI